MASDVTTNRTCNNQNQFGAILGTGASGFLSFVLGLKTTVTMFQELSRSIKSAKGKLYAVKCDVTMESHIKSAFKWVEENLGGVDILVNNAGVAIDSSLIGKSP